MEGTALRTASSQAVIPARIKAFLVLAAGVAALLMAVAMAAPLRAYAADVATVKLGTASSFSVLAGQTVTNTGPSTLQRDLGVSPNNAVTGFPPGTVGGATHKGDAVANKAQQDLTTAYNNAAGRPSNVDLTGKDLGGKTLIAGVNTFSSSAQLTGSLTLDGQGDPTSVFIFQIGSTLTTASASSINLVRGAQACNVFFQVGSSATLGTGTRFTGTILALTSISANSGATINGRLLARNGSVTLDNNVITSPACAAATPTPTTSATPTASGTPTASNTPTATVTSSATSRPSPSNSPTATVTSSATSGPLPSNSPTATVTSSVTSRPSPSHSPTASHTPTATGSQSRTAAPVATKSEAATPGTGGSHSHSGSGSVRTLANTGASGLTSLLGIGGVLLLLMGGVILAIAGNRSRPKRRH